MSVSRLDRLAKFIIKFRYLLIVFWAGIIVVSIAFVPSFFGAVVYDLTESSTTSPEDSEAQQTLKILEDQFPNIENQSGDSIILVIKSENVYSDNIRKSLFSLENTLNMVQPDFNYTGIADIYSVEGDLLRSFIPEYGSQIKNLSSLFSLINSGIYNLEGNFTLLLFGLSDLNEGLVQTSQVVYGIPVMYTTMWINISSQYQLDNIKINEIANKTFLESTANLNGDLFSLSYYSTFFRIWNESFIYQPSLSPFERAQLAVNESIPIILRNPQIDPELAQIFNSVATGLDITNWDNDIDISRLAINLMAAQIPNELTESLGLSSVDLLTLLYPLIPAPNSEGISNLVIDLFTNSLINQSESFNGLIPRDSSDVFSEEFVIMAYNLGKSPSDELLWKFVSSLVTNSTVDSLSDSPLFSINKSALFDTLLDLKNKNATILINEILLNQKLDNYPIIPSPNIIRNFIDSKNSTMIAIVAFDSLLDSSSIDQIKKIIGESDLNSNSDIYITGNSVFSEDMSEIFSEAEGMTIIAGILMSLIISGFLFRSPVAAVFPLLISGISILISYPAIYLGVVVIGGGTISFLTPILTVLLMLGLGVDYSVILLRRTREERIRGKSRDDSITISTRWAGQAVVTAAIAVITSYVVMAISQIPTFSDVGIAIAIGVSVLLLVAITLVPSLEVLLGDKLFWPGLKSKINNIEKKENILSRIADSTLKRRIPIVLAIGLLGIGSLYVANITPTGMDFQKLLPDFDSNRGITEIVENMGSDFISPTQIVVVMSTPIVNTLGELNQESLNIIEQLTVKIRSAEGISSVTSTTQPFNTEFDYESVYSLSEPIRSQYLTSIFETIGKNNQTLLINVGLEDPPFSSDAIESLLDLKTEINGLAIDHDVEIHFGGTTQSIYESQSLLDSIFPRVVIILVAAIYLLLLIQLWSAFTPLRLIYTVLTSVVVSLALIYITFYFILDIPIISFIALFVVVTMLGVGIDYDIFLVTRIREEVLNGKSDNEAIKTAITKTAGTIMGLGLILSSVFGSLIFTGMPILQEIGMAVSGAVLFDTFIVILFVVPALMGLAQSLNWWPTKPKRSVN